MQMTVINMCEKFHEDRSRNDGALGDWKSDNNTKKNIDENNAWGPVSGCKNCAVLVQITTDGSAEATGAWQCLGKRRRRKGNGKYSSQSGVCS